MFKLISFAFSITESNITHGANEHIILQTYNTKYQHDQSSDIRVTTISSLNLGFGVLFQNSYLLSKFLLNYQEILKI